MSLAAGTRLGPYEILAVIGAGGMGEVYKARDTRLDRTVAIKILLADIADAKHGARFEREAHLIAALSHPHICTLYDVGEHEASMFLVMEHVMGQTLADRLQKGPLPVDQAIEVAGQVAEALNAAHKQGIVHRDLKPANVMLTKSGVKLLDFGVAKLKTQEPTALAGLTSLPTASQPLTARGTILGTLHYMAPEQLEGKEADARADLWALGAMLYEMVCGRRAFDGASSASVIAAILEREPVPLDTLQPLTPPALDQLVRRCLTKEPNDRWDSAHDVKLQLAENKQPPVQGSCLAAVVTHETRGRDRFDCGSDTIGFVAGRRVPHRDVRNSGVARLVVSATAGIVPMGSESTVAVSADGRLIVFLGRVRESTQVFLRRLDSEEVVLLEGTAGAESPFLSPDGRWVGFFQEGKLRKVPIEGGTPQTIADAPSGRGAVWRSDGTIFFAPLYSGPIFKVLADGGTPRPVTTLNTAAGENSHRFPKLLPGDVLLFTVRTGGGFENAEIAAVRLSSGERRTLVSGGVHGEYLSTGHLVFAKGTTLMAAPFDATRLATLASPAALLEDVRYDRNGGIADFAVSDTGTLVYAPASLYSTPAELVSISRDGVAQRITEERRLFREVSVSPNGRSVLVSIENGDRIEGPFGRS